MPKMNRRLLIQLSFSKKNRVRRLLRNVAVRDTCHKTVQPGAPAFRYGRSCRWQLRR
jgi:hypothetical protein